MLNMIFTIGGVAIVAMLGVLAGRYLFKLGGSSDSSSAEAPQVELALLQERERLAVDQIAKLEDRLSVSNSTLEKQGAELTSAKERLAANEERIVGLEKALAREKELAEEITRRLTTELGDVTRTKDFISKTYNEQSQKLAAAEQLETELRGQLKRASDHISDRDSAIKSRDDQLDTIRTRLSIKESELAGSAEREASLSRAVVERDEQLNGLQERLRVEFENIANKILAVTTDKLSEKSNEALTAILEPLRTRIIEFQNKVETTHLEDTRQRSALAEHIKLIAQTNLNLGTQAENLAKALRGDAQLRGRWGEVRLERILESSGLVRGREFVIQGEGLNLKGDDGGSQRPDIIILLPENRHFVIDSKLSLIDYLDYEAADTDEARTACLKKLLQSVRGHIDGLSAKNYQYADAINSHDLVFMFVPIEGIAALVLQTDDSLFEYAWSRKIVMVSPSTLFMTMRTVSSIWRYERQSENAQQIAEQAGQLYDKIVGVVGDMNDVSQKLQSAADAHGEAMKKLATGKGSALSRTQRLKALGVSSKKELPQVLINGEKHTVESGGDDVVPVAITPIPALLERSDPGNEST
ncbi:MAG: DNA recombination protein RmuC [Proteobacteria bacterium]|nr:DNA recombination protein RmuC [Pseudomonadota bacterium]